MGTRLILPLLCVLCAGPLLADFTAKVKGTVNGNDRQGLEGVKITAEFDPDWGQRTPEDVEKYKRDHGPFPEVEASGEVITGADGKFDFPVEVKVSGEGRLPQTSIRIGNQNQQVDFVRLKLTFTKDGYRTVYSTSIATDGESESVYNWQLTMSRLYSFKAKLVHMADRKPVASAKVLVLGRRTVEGRVVDEELEVTTDANGMLTLGDSEVPSGRLQMRMNEDNLAFARVSGVWNGLPMREGENDGGSLVVVSGGSLKLKAVHADSGENLYVRGYLTSEEDRQRFQFNFDAPGGETLMKGIPEGNYTLSLNTNGGAFWAYATSEVEVKAGQVTDLGECAIEPHRSIEVFAVSAEGAGIPNFVVVAEQISGYRADQRRAWDDPNRKDEPWRVSASCTAEKNKVERLARGRWKITVQAEGYSPGSTEVDIPASDPVFVKLEQGGKLTIKPDENDFEWEPRFETVVAIASDSPAWPELDGLPGTAIVARALTKADTGVFVARRQWGNTPGFSALPPGTYTVIASMGRETALRSDDVEIRKGETTELVLKKLPGEITVKVTDNGQPLAQELIYLVPRQSFGRDEAPKTISAATDALGVVVFENVPAGSYQLLTRRQHDWVNAGQTRFGSRRSVPLGPEQDVTVGHGDRITSDVDVYQPHFVWVTVNLKRDKGVGAIEVKLTELRGQVGLNEINPVATGDVYEFGMLRKGPYEFSLQVANTSGRGYRLLKLLQVDQPPEQEFEVELELAELEVKVKPPKGFEGHQVNVYLQQAHEYEWCSWESPGAGGHCDAKGKIEFKDVPEGAYRVVAWAEDERGRATFITSEDIELKGSKRVSLKFDERVGDLHVRFEDSIGMRYEQPMRVELLDGDKRAEMGNPQHLFRQNSGVTLAAVAKGTYTLRISIAGYEPYEQEDVKIETGGTTSLTVKLVKMCRVTLKLKGAVPESQALGQAEFDCLDASGAVIDVGDVEHDDTFHSGKSWEGTWLHLSHVPANCARIRLKIDGCKEITVEVKPDRKEVHEVEVELEAE